MKLRSFLIVFLSGAATFIFAQPPIPDPAGRWVIDDAYVLSETTERTVSTLCQQEFDSTSNQVVVYTFNSLEGSTIEAYANEVYNKWQLGSKENNNGILLIIAINDRIMRIEVGYGLESYLTDLEAGDIIENEIKPEFKQGDYDHGVIKGVQNIMYGIRNSYVAPYKSTQVYSTQPGKARQTPWKFFGLACFVWFGISFLLSRVHKFDAVAVYCTLGIFVFAFLVVIAGFLFSAVLMAAGLVVMIGTAKIWKPKKPIILIKAGSGGGNSWSGSSYTSSNNSYTSSDNSYSSGSSYSNGGGGDFSGGGGSSGGGGASGSW